jgi:hypothetical protein
MPALSLIPAVNDAPQPALGERARRNAERRLGFKGPYWSAPVKQTHVA